MRKVVLDANIILSGFAKRLGPPGKVLDAWRDRRFELVTSDYILNEVANELNMRYFNRSITRPRRKRIISLLRHQARHTELTTTVTGVAPDPDDDPILATAKSSGATIIVTGDAAFQSVDIFEGIQILSPTRFLVLLENGGEQLV